MNNCTKFAALWLNQHKPQAADPPLPFKFVFLHLFFNVKGSFILIFTKELIFGSPGIFTKLIL